ncbi:MAG: component of SufBCD complex [Paracoccaceae bacterium]
MEIYQTLFDTIDVRSFSNIWFWLVLVFAWARATHYVIGVPFDLILRARRRGGDFMEDMLTLADVQARRRLYILGRSGIILVVLWFAIMTTLAMLGFGYGSELAQALALLLVPLTIAQFIGIRLTHRIVDGVYDGPTLARKLMWHRLAVQAIGLLAIFVTTMWGMLHNLSHQALGG